MFPHRFSALLLLIALAGASAFAQQRPSWVLGEETVKISDHVWAIMGNPNIAIVVGKDATLVVDTGLGPPNGATIMKAVAKLGPTQKLFVTTTHFHPEHAAGDIGFPPQTILIRDTVQQKEMELHGAEMITMFANMNPTNKELLSTAKPRNPDILFDTEARVDLGGGVSARLLWFGGAHTKGDELVLVEPDATLVSGDVVQNKVVPNIFGDGGTPASWIAVLDKVATLNVKHVLPDHSAPGDGSLVGKERAFISDLRTAALALKAKGISAEDAAKQLDVQFKAKYSDWPSMSTARFVASIYSE